MSRLEIKALGGCREVGRAAIQLTAGDTRVLLDYGIKIRRRKPPLYPEEPDGKVNYVALTHAHLDHSGAIPLLMKKKPPKVLGIDLTREYTEILLWDSLRVAKKNSYEARYGEREILEFHRNYREVEYEHGVKLRGGIEIRALSAGHIPGSAMFYIRHRNKTILYTGDFNFIDTRLVEGMTLELPKVDVLIMETTYATRKHPPRSSQERELKQIIDETCSRRGTVIIPGFALARLEEISMVLYVAGTSWPVFMDGMARNIVKITLRYPNRVRDYRLLRQALSKINYVRDQKMRDKIAGSPSVVLTTSGMLEGGPVVYYVAKLHDSSESTVAIVGYQAEDTNGRRLIEERKLELSEGDLIDVNMQVRQLDFSAHTDITGMKYLIKKTRPKAVLCVHGEEANKFASEIEDTYGTTSIAPKEGETLKI